MSEWMTMMNPLNIFSRLLEYNFEFLSTYLVNIRINGFPILDTIKNFGGFNSYVGLITCFGLAIITIVLSAYLYGKLRSKELKIPPLRLPTIRHGKPRFRKRDKLAYYATRLKRKLTDMTHEEGTSKAKAVQQQLIQQLTRRLSLKKTDIGPLLKKRALPEHLVEPRYEEEAEDSSMPDDFLLVLNSIRVFGHIDKTVFAKLCRRLETVHLEVGECLFRVGDPDENIFVVQQGKLRVKVNEKDGSEYTIHEVVKGGHIHSLLSILDVLTGHSQPYKTVTAVALTASTVLKLPAQALADVLEDSPETVVRIIQVIAIRLRRVTFTALHDYLGLNVELISQDSLALSTSDIAKRFHSSFKEEPAPAPQQTVTSSYDAVGLVTTSITRPIQIMRGRSRSRSQSPVGFRPPVDTITGFVDAATNVELDKDRGLELGEACFVPSSRNTGPRKSRTRDRGPTREISIEEMTSLDSDTLLNMAKTDLIELFGIQQQPDLLDQMSLSLSYFNAGTTLARQGVDVSHLYYVISGELRLMQNVEDVKAMVTMYSAKPGDMVDVLSVLTGEASFFTIRAEKSSIVLKIAGDEFHKLICLRPHIVLQVSNLMVRRMSPFLRQIDFALEWTRIEAGRPLYKQGDISDCVYIVLNGRLRQVNILPNGKRQIVSEMSKGDVVGLLEVLSQQPRATTVMSVRDTEVAQIPADLLTMIKLKQPQVVSRLIHILADRLLDRIQSPTALVHEAGAAVQSGPDGMPRSQLGNLRTVALVPTSEDVPLEAFTLELQHALTLIGSSVRLNTSILLQRLGPRALDAINEYRLLTWLNHQEDAHRLMMYQCDYYNSVWTRRCIRQADCIIVVAVAKANPTLGSLEAKLESNSKVAKILVLLHPEDLDYPPIGRTAEWLNLRPWVSQHFHVRVPKRVLRGSGGERLMRTYKRVFEQRTANPLSDISRFARYLTGTAVGLVLGGGGARGCSHVGVIKAFQEAGIPIDIVGGTSIGSFIGALWAEETTMTRFIQRAREFSMEMSSLWKKILDITYPYVAMFSGKKFNDALESTFKDRQIEDLWIPYFCVTTDITHSRMRVHTQGSLWRYVRASMSLSGYLPPLCDPYDGSLLLDGGYVNNLPADVMLTFGASTIFAVDVGSHDETDLTNYGDWISGTKHVIQRWLPFTTPQKVLSLTEIQSRLAYVSCVRQLEQVKESGICEYLRPPIEKFQTLQFGAFDEIQDVGYQYAQARIEEWKRHSRLQQFTFSGASSLVNSRSETYNMLASGPSSRSSYVNAYEEKLRFTDLAEKVTRIEDTNKEIIYYDSCSDYEESDHSSEDDDETEVVSDPELFERDFFEDKSHSYRRVRGLSADLHMTTRKRVKFEPTARRRSLDDIQDLSHMSSSV